MFLEGESPILNSHSNHPIYWLVTMVILSNNSIKFENIFFEWYRNKTDMNFHGQHKLFVQITIM